VARAAFAGLLAALLLAGCGGYGDDSAGSTSTATTASDPLANASTETVTVDASSDQTALLETVGMSGHDTYDRIVFTFKNVVPGYKVGYVSKPVTEDGSGAKVTIEGSAVLSIRMEPASGFDVNTGEGVMVYKGPKRIAAVATGTQVVNELVRTGDFEAVLNWVAGLPEQVPFAVSTDDDPPRLVVDVKNP
jgi:hypothetical protein